MGGFLVSKLVKPTKIFCSRAPHHGDVNQLLVSQAKPWARQGHVVQEFCPEANSTVSQELGGLDSTNGVLQELAEFLALLRLSATSASREGDRGETG